MRGSRARVEGVWWLEIVAMITGLR